MKLQPQLKSDASKVMVITVVFILINWYLTFYNDGLLSTPYSLGTSDIYDLRLNYALNTLTGILAGTIGGSALVFVNKRYFRKKSYSYAMKATFLAYTAVFVFVTVIMSFLSARIILPEAGFGELLEVAAIYMYGKMTLIFYILWGTVTLFTLFFLQIYDKFGSGMFLKFLTGKYHQPREEQRIFMFLDMKSSTTIAEKIGSKKYFNLLNDLFTDMTDPILSCEGEIYQYIGDEVVVSWSMEKGVRQANCLHCFRGIREKVADLAPYYENEYGVIPEFKAGLHFGLVTAGEIGSIKKDIVYSGDVLNTTSRIQEQCNHYQVDFLVSNETFDLMGKQVPYEAVPLGNIELRGKKTRIDLITLKAIAESQAA